MKIEKKIAKQLGKRVQTLRKKKGWSQEQLAVEARVSTNYIGEIERAECNISLHVIVWVAQALQIPITALFEEDRLI